jgi:hypothetical protein
MGLFYTTFTTRGPNQAQVIDALRAMDRAAFVSPTVDEYTVIYDRTAEEQDFAEIEKLGSVISKQISAPILAAVLHDDDVLYLWLFQDGRCQDFYNSLPQYFDPDAEPGPPEGGDVEAVCKAFGISGNCEELEVVLRANLLDGEAPEILGELERHQCIVKMLGMPPFAAEVTFSSIEGQYLSDEFQEFKFMRVGGS